MLVTSGIHILVLGQSNVANHGETPLRSDFGSAHHHDSFFPLADPLPGGSGQMGSVWSRFAPLARDRLGLDDLVISLLAQGGACVADWTPGGKCFAGYMKELPFLLACRLPVSHIVFHQGEADTLHQTSKQQYMENFCRLYEAVAADFPHAHWLVCQASYRFGRMNEAVRGAQAAIASNFAQCSAGPDTDQLGPEYRHDNTHFNEEGLSQFADSLIRCFAHLPDPNRSLVSNRG